MQFESRAISSPFSPLQHCNSTTISLLNDLNSVDRIVLKLSKLSLVNVLLYDGSQFDDLQNAFILILRIKCRVNSEGFSGALFYMKVIKNYFFSVVLYPP